jgi:hypothetical protein
MRIRLSKKERKRRAAFMRALHADPKFQAANRARITRRHANPKFAAKRDLISRRTLKRRWEDPAFRAAATERIKKLYRDPAFHAAASRRMKKLRRDPAFNASRRKAIKRLNADPKILAANRARLKRLKADPAFRAKHRASVSLPARTHAAIVAALRAGATGVSVARSTRVNRCTVYRIAKRAGIKITRPLALTPAQITRARRRIDAGERLYLVARHFGIHPETLSRCLSWSAPQNVSAHQL